MGVWFNLMVEINISISAIGDGYGFSNLRNQIRKFVKLGGQKYI